MSTAITINGSEIARFLHRRGFQKINIPGVKEDVYSKRVSPTISIRVYSSIENGESRKTGSDAIRVTAFAWIGDGPRMIGSTKRVHRVEGWRENLDDRLWNWRILVGPQCPKCGAPTVLRKPKKGKKWRPFYGCVHFPNCTGSTSTR